MASYRFGYEYDEPDRAEYPYESYYGGGNGKKPRRGGHGGLWLLLALALLAAGIFALLSRYSFDVRRTESGMSVVIRDTNKTAKPAEAPPLQPAAEKEPQPLQPSAPENGPQLVLGEVPAASSHTADGGELSLREIYQKVYPSVVSITSTGRGGTGMGTGIVMSGDGYLITNEHVVEGAVAIEVLTSDDRTWTASLVGSDSTSDLAVLKVDAEGLTPAEFGNSDQLMVGDTVVAIGDPLGRKLRGSMTDGIVSAIDRDLVVNGRSMTLIQTNAALNNGNSGGPLINGYGQVVGVNTMKLSSYYTSASIEGLGFAIPISSAKPIIDELIEHGYVTGRPALGITGRTLPSVYQAYYRIPDGVYVEAVDPASDAYAKGLREGDVIVAFAGEAVGDMDALNVVKNKYKAGDEVELNVYRNGEAFVIRVILGEAAG